MANSAGRPCSGKVPAPRQGGCPARLLTLAKVHCHRVFAPARLPDCLPSAPPLAPLGPRRDRGARHARDRRAGMRSAATGTTFCSKHGISARTAQPRHKRGKRHGLFFTRKRQRRPSPRPATRHQWHHRSGPTVVGGGRGRGRRAKQGQVNGRTTFKTRPRELCMRFRSQYCYSAAKT